MLSEPKHDHHYKVNIVMEGQPNEEGFVVDYRAVKRLFKRLVPLDERDLDELFEYPTSEVLAIWIWDRLAPFFPLHSIEVREKAHSVAVYHGPLTGGASS
jgi:6-pyruvoyltetrahydropterin/6-carboxytetrahydropterin synthase